MSSVDDLIGRNRAWAAAKVADDPAFFERLVEQQTPRYMWIGCADSRVPANEIVALAPGEMFVHRNVANVVVHTDLNCLSVLQYAVWVLGVEHVIVCGHYGCGGVRAAMERQRHGLIDNWLRHVQDVHDRHRLALDRLPTEPQRLDRMCELNVLEQVVNVGRTTIVETAWEQGRPLSLHAWAYGLHDGIVKVLAEPVESPAGLVRLRAFLADAASA